MRSSNTVLIVAGVLAAVLAMLAVRWGSSGRDDAPAISDTQRPMRARQIARHAARPVAVAEAGAELAAVGPLLSSTPEAANDVVFLTVAAAYGRCMPAHAHELGAMAARARLPVLAGLAGVDATVSPTPSCHWMLPGHGSARRSAPMHVGVSPDFAVRAVPPPHNRFMIS